MVRPTDRRVGGTRLTKETRRGNSLPLEAIEPRRLYRQIADQLRHLIDQGEYAVGSRLPAERVLADRLGVSRPSVRGALIVLEVDCSVKMRVGCGMYVFEKQPGAVVAAIAEIVDPLGRLRERSIVERKVR